MTTNTIKGFQTSQVSLACASTDRFVLSLSLRRPFFSYARVSDSWDGWQPLHELPRTNARYALGQSTSVERSQRCDLV